MHLLPMDYEPAVRKGFRFPPNLVASGKRYGLDKRSFKVKNRKSLIVEFPNVKMTVDDLYFYRHIEITRALTLFADRLEKSPLGVEFLDIVGRHVTDIDSTFSV